MRKSIKNVTRCRDSRTAKKHFSIQPHQTELFRLSSPPFSLLLSSCSAICTSQDIFYCFVVVVVVVVVFTLAYIIVLTART